MFRRADGAVGLKVDWLPPFVAPDVGRRGTWQPRSALPPAEIGGGRVEIFYTPHPDDETLSMGPLIVRAKAAGMRVIIVSMTDGRTSSARAQVDARLTKAGYPALPITAFGQARDEELRRAAVALGVAPEDLFMAHLDAPDSDCGAAVTVGEATDVMAAMNERFPGALHVTMSFVADRNLDHLACGSALRELVRARLIQTAEWTVARLWWSLPGPPSHWVLPADRAQRTEIAAAASAYARWDPSAQSYAIGGLSVPPQFEALALDPRARVHGSPTTP